MNKKMMFWGNQGGTFVAFTIAMIAWALNLHVLFGVFILATLVKAAQSQ
ncbi:hypothetical protein VIN01S_27840 [Vibrio inusitatus NBRC 102082]|uniref:Uncharacterized protein n=1 Tax=Vibrio inusitatus NBRC 102082 TaxID=1219070 RepID=A0A4Y3HZ32_9VIBR|nr:hypothetical protein [Vibrio inusitatus]GEA51980.1 hypothetical protein VIN01S_27840 [Vibrio inusitatus NBRC 102082]